MTINTKSPTGSGRRMILHPKGHGSADDASDSVQFKELEVVARDRQTGFFTIAVADRMSSPQSMQDAIDPRHTPIASPVRPHTA